MKIGGIAQWLIVFQVCDLVMLMILPRFFDHWLGNGLVVGLISFPIALFVDYLVTKVRKENQSAKFKIPL